MLPLVSTTMPRLTGTRSAAEMRDGHRLVVLVDDEVLLAQAGDEPAAGVGHRRRDVDQLDAALEAEARLLGFGLRRRRLRRRLLPVQRDDERREQRRRASRLRMMPRMIVTASPVRRARRSTCGTIRSSVRKLTRYRPTSPAPGTVTTKIDSPPAAAPAASTVTRPLDRNPPSRLKRKTTAVSRSTAAPDCRIAHDAADGQAIAVPFVAERHQLERRRDRRRRGRRRRRLVRRVRRAARSAAQNDDERGRGRRRRRRRRR